MRAGPARQHDRTPAMTPQHCPGMTQARGLLAKPGLNTDLLPAIAGNKTPTSEDAERPET